MAQRPNLLFIMSDDHAAHAMGCGGNAQVRTPALDRLASEGVYFENNFCQMPICTASRQCILTGKLPHSIDVPFLFSALSDGEYTLAHHLRGQGYDTVSIGKMHFNSSLHHGFRVRIDEAEHCAWLRNRPRRPLPEGMRVQPEWKPFEDPASVWLNSETLPVPFYDDEMQGTYFAQRAAEYLQSVGNEPFALWLSFYEPHSPFYFPVEYRGLFRAEDITLPETAEEDVPQIPLVFRDLTERERRGIAAAYYTSIAYLDKSIAIALDALEGAGHWDDTVVVYLPDHGYLTGRHGRFEKHCFYEDSVKTGMILRAPGMLPAGERVRALTESMDIVPTLCALLGLEPPAGIQGKSLVPLPKNSRSTVHDEVFSEYFYTHSAMVRTEEWKLIYSSGGAEDWYRTEALPQGSRMRLYRLTDDLGELHDRSGDPACADVRDRLLLRLLQRFRETWPKKRAAPAGLTAQRELDYYLCYFDNLRPVSVK